MEAVAKLKNIPTSPRKMRMVADLIRGKKVMLDRDLAELYEVTTKQLNQAVKRNPERFQIRQTLREAETISLFQKHLRAAIMIDTQA